MGCQHMRFCCPGADLPGELIVWLAIESVCYGAVYPHLIMAANVFGIFHEPQVRYSSYNIKEAGKPKAISQLEVRRGDFGATFAAGHCSNNLSALHLAHSLWLILTSPCQHPLLIICLSKAAGCQPCRQPSRVCPPGPSTPTFTISIFTPFPPCRSRMWSGMLTWVPTS